MRVAGVDEAGRGPLAGPVVAAAVILDPSRPIAGLADSKALAPEVRARLAVEIREHALAWSVALASPAEIDTLYPNTNRNATLLTMRRALAGLQVAPDHVEIDGNRLPRLEGLVWAQAAPTPTVETVVRGDASRPAISAASILAKTLRDTLMEQLDTRHPGYGFAVHKGYPTAAHLAALRAQGISAVHRRSFGPVRLLAP